MKTIYDGKCCWVIGEWVIGEIAGSNCGKPTGFKIVFDDDGNKVRKYNSFCPKHAELAEQEDM